MIKVTETSPYIAFSKEVAELLKDQLGDKFPIKGKIETSVQSFSVAPPITSRSNHWTTGSLHRDGGMNKGEPFYLSVMVFIEEVTELNGGIEFFENSIDAVIDEKKPIRTTSLLKSFTITGEKGTVLMWDVKKLHRGGANKSDEFRTVMVFQVHPADFHLEQDKYLKFNHEI